MKRYEVIHHLLHGVFPWQHLYTLARAIRVHACLRWYEGQCSATPSNLYDSLPL